MTILCSKYGTGTLRWILLHIRTMGHAIRMTKELEPCVTNSMLQISDINQ